MKSLVPMLLACLLLVGCDQSELGPEPTAPEPTAPEPVTPQGGATPGGGGGGGGGGIAEISEDPTPQLGGDLDLNQYDAIFQLNSQLNDANDNIFLWPTIRTLIAQDGTTGMLRWSDNTKLEALVAMEVEGEALNATKIQDWDNVKVIVESMPLSEENFLISGGAYWDSGLTFNVTALEYVIGGTQYSSVATNLTLSAADPALDRIDVIAAEVGGTVVVVEGTAATTPVKPEITADQVEVTFVTVAAGQVQPDVTRELIYDENTGDPTEWNAWDIDANVAPHGAVDAHSGTTHVNAVNATRNDALSLTDPSNTFDLADYDTLVFRIKNVSVPANFKLELAWSMTLGTVDVTRGLILQDGAYGYDVNNTTTYQDIIIPMGDFVPSGDVSLIDGLRIKQLVNTASSWRIDEIELLGGQGTEYNQLLWAGFVADTGTTVADRPNDVLRVTGGTGVDTTIADDELTIDANYGEMLSAMFGFMEFELPLGYVGNTNDDHWTDFVLKVYSVTNSSQAWGLSNLVLYIDTQLDPFDALNARSNYLDSAVNIYYIDGSDTNTVRGYKEWQILRNDGLGFFDVNDNIGVQHAGDVVSKAMVYPSHTGCAVDWTTWQYYTNAHRLRAVYARADSLGIETNLDGEVWSPVPIRWVYKRPAED